MSELQYYPAEAVVPERLETDHCVLTMLSIVHNPLDYEAVMATADRLRARTHGRWPHEGFTLAENLADLEMHEGEHRERVAFTYTILDRSERRCLGCLYLRPISRIFAGSVVTEGALPPCDHASTADFWTVPRGIVDVALESGLLDALVAWFDSEWAFERVYWTTTEAELEQLALFHGTLRRAFVAEGADRGTVRLGFVPIAT